MLAKEIGAKVANATPGKVQEGGYSPLRLGLAAVGSLCRLSPR